MNPRRLKVEPMGDSFRRPVTRTMIRLKGRWLKEAGFEPGQHIEVIMERSGCLILRDAALDKP